MSSNVVLQSAFLPNQSAGDDLVRVDFILENIFAYQVGDVYEFIPMNNINEKEKDVFEKIKARLNEFKGSYVESIRRLCAEIVSVTEDNVGSILLGVANEVFSEGITWSRIIAFFVFVGELSVMCITRNQLIVDAIFQNFAVLVKDKLMMWIEDHDGWEGIESVSVSSQQENVLEMSISNWARNFLHATLRVFGTLASIANTTSNGFNEF